MSLIPQEQPQLIGFDKLEAELLNQFETGNIHHAHIITGPSGCGKASFALAMARKIFEQSSDEHLDTINRKIEAGSYPNLLRIERGYDDKKNRQQSEIVKDQIAPLYGFIRQTAADGGWRIIIIDRADTMNRTVQNAVLKSLEEPRAKTLFFLTVENKSQLLPTILSRCQQHHVTAASYDEVLAFLNQSHDKDIQDLSTDDKALYAWLSQGCIGRCVNMIKDEVADLWRDIITAYIARSDNAQKSYMDFAEEIGKNRSYDESYETLSSLIRFLWTEALFYQTFEDNDQTQLSSKDQKRIELFEHCVPEKLRERFHTLGAKTLMKHYQQTDKELREAQRGYLDKKVVALQILRHIKTPSQPTE